MSLTQVLVVLLAWGLERALSEPPEAADTTPHRWVRVSGGSYRPLFAASDREAVVTVGAMDMMETPVTNAQFLAFVLEQEQWQRAKVHGLFADSRYLSHWQGSTLISDTLRDFPVTQVSWFAAKAYCEHHGARLPNEAEWEMVAKASELTRSGQPDPAWQARITEWYSSPSAGPGRKVGEGPANRWGVRDMHGLVWEWVSDFNGVMVTSDSRSTRTDNVNTFCGAGALAASDVSDYATFMRTAFRSSLEGRRTARHLGFRCVRDVKAGPS